jgi:hypothetical protein
MCDISEVRQKFVKRRGFFNQVYYSLRLHNFEITVDNQTPKNQYLVCLCSPYNERMDHIRHHRGMGGGEVKKDWTFNDEEDAFKFVATLV